MSKKPKQTIPFTPVQIRYRHDGWTPAKQIAFIEALAVTGIVDEACRRVGMSDTSAYEFRMRPCAGPFRQAWDFAIDYFTHVAESDAWKRCREGVPRPIFYKGEQVGEWRHFDERLTMFLLSHRRAHRFGKWIDKAELPEITNGIEFEDDAAPLLDSKLDEIGELDGFDDEPDDAESSGSAEGGDEAEEGGGSSGNGDE